MYPNNQQYKNSVNSGLFLPNGVFTQNYYSPFTYKNGELIYETGQNATVFKVKDISGTAKALKMFFREDPERSHRYKEIGGYLKRLNSSYFINFEYCERFIYVEVDNNAEQDNYFPVVVMDWIDGVTLENKIKDLTSKNDTSAIKYLLEKFMDLSRFLISSDFAHGDLKHDNIIVDKDLNLKLIDYDGLFVPVLGGKPSFELGTKSFQHPNRSKEDFNRGIDDFSILTLYVSLLTFLKYPSYYKRFSDQQNLFFREEDFLDPINSEIFGLLNLDNDLGPYAKSIIISLAKEDIYIDNLLELLNGKFPEPGIKSKIKKQYSFYEEDKKQLFFKTKNCDDITIKLNDLYYPDYYFDKDSSELIINLNDNKSSEISILLKNSYTEKVLKSLIQIQPKPDFIYYKFSNDTYKQGDKVILKYKFRNVKYAELKSEFDNDFSITIPNENGSIQFIIENSSTYYLIIEDLLGNKISTKHTHLNIVYPIEIQNFESNFQNIFEGVPVELSWTVKHADRILLKTDRFETEDVTGLEQICVNPVRNVIYSLECVNKYYSAKSSHSILLNVFPNPHKLSLENLTPNLKDLNLEYNLEKVDLSDFNLDLPSFNINLNLKIDIKTKEAIEIKSIDKKSIRTQLINLFNSKK